MTNHMAAMVMTMNVPPIKREVAMIRCSMKLDPEMIFELLHAILRHRRSLVQNPILYSRPVDGLKKSLMKIGRQRNWTKIL